MNPIQAAVRSVRKAIKAVVHPVLAPLAIRSLRDRAASCADREAALDLAFSFDYAAIRINPVQVRSEIAALLDLLAAHEPRTILEVGTANGGTLFLFSRVAAPGAQLISIDLPGNRAGDGYPAYKAALYQSFARPGQRIDLLLGDSHASDTATRASALLQGKSVDFLFIDGDHSYEGVRSDFELYAPMVRPGGMIAFHDIVPGPTVGGVPRFWGELKEKTRMGELVEDWAQGGYGIGHVTRPEA